MHPGCRRLIILLLISAIILPLYAQEQSIIYDGTIGIHDNWMDNKSSKIIIRKVDRKGPADLAGLRKGDTIVEVNGQNIYALDLPRTRYWDLMHGAGGSSVDIAVRRPGNESLLHFSLKRDTALDSWIRCHYDYLVDSAWKFNIQEILSDTVQSLFESSTNKKISIYSVDEGGAAEKAGIQPGDKIISLEDELYINFYIDNGNFGTIDTVFSVSRDSTTFDLDLAEYNLMDIVSSLRSQIYNDMFEETFWLRLTLENRLAEDRDFLFNFHFNFDSILLHEVKDSMDFTVKRSGEDLAVNQRDFMLKGNNYMKVSLEKSSTQTFYAKVYMESGVSYTPLVSAISHEFVISYDRKERFVLGGIFGMMLIIALYYGIMSLLMKQRSYALFMLFILSYSLLMLDDTGYGRELFGGSVFTDWKIWENGLIALPVFFFLLFGNLYLNLNTSLRYWYRTVSILALMIFLFIVISIAGNSLFTSYRISNFASVIDSVFVIGLFIGMALHIITSILRIRQRYKPAWYFLAANVIAIVFLLYKGYASPGVEYESDAALLFSDTILMAVGVVQFLIFSVGLGQKIRIGEKEKEAAREELFSQLKENEKLKDKVNRELEHLVKERTSEISQQKEEIETQRDELVNQRDILENQQKEITDSINYAKKIQTAVLPSDDLLGNVFPGHLVIFRPRDIVSGDFYWYRQIKNFTVVVAADSTGHGVPGAFMSMLGISFLNELVNKSRFDSAGEILDRLRKKVKTTLNQEEKMDPQRDGMDIALLIIDHDTMEVQYAGAFNPLFIIRQRGQSPDPELDIHITFESDDAALMEFKADRQPISIYFNEKEFTTRYLKLRKDDLLYIFSDGYIDQIGGPAGKKFKVKKFKELLLDIGGEKMLRQKEILESTLDDWKKNYEQLDDILVIGIRL